MNDDRHDRGRHPVAAALQQAFDSGFSRPHSAGDDDSVDALAISVAGRPCVIALEHVEALDRAPAVTRLPAASDALLGLATRRGHVLPVFDLAVLAGFAVPADSRSNSWMIVVSGPHDEQRVMLVFEAFGGYVRAPAALVEAGRAAGDDETGDQASLYDIDGVKRRAVRAAEIIGRIQTMCAQLR